MAGCRACSDGTEWVVHGRAEQLAADANRHTWLLRCPRCGTSDLVDQLNADHARQAQGLPVAAVVDHLRQAGDDIAALVRSLGPEQLDRDSGRPRRLAQIAIRHADGHRTELERFRI